MKRTILLPVFSFIFLFSMAQTYNSSCVPSGDMQAVYHNDAYKIATKRLNQVNSPWKDSVLIPDIFVDSIANALYAIENMQNSPLRDTIMLQFGYRSFLSTPDPFPYADSSHSFHPYDYMYKYRMKQISITLHANPSLSSIDSVNYLVSRYNLTSTPSTFYTLLESPVAVNIPALINQFLAISGVQYAYQIPYIGDGNKIAAEFSNGDIILTYYVGCGDCPSGCTFGRAWKFKVKTGSDCSVEYLGAYNTGFAAILSLDELGFSDCIGVVVPVHLATIKVSQKNNYQLVEWQMNAEDNVDHYVIERSADAVNYNDIGHVNAHYTSGEVHYSWIDNDALSGKNFYRIKIVYRSGSESYSPVAVLDIKLTAGITIAPAPAGSRTVNLYFNKAEKGSYTVLVLNTAGQTIYSTQLDINAEAISKQIHIPASVPAGTYIVSVRTRSAQKNQLIVLSGN